MFKLPKEKDQSKMTEAYQAMRDSVPKKNGKPYILSLVCGPANQEERSQGYTFVAKSEFASAEDIKYYDEECEAHQALKAAAKELQLAGPPLTVCFAPTVVGGKPEAEE